MAKLKTDTQVDETTTSGAEVPQVTDETPQSPATDEQESKPQVKPASNPVSGQADPPSNPEGNNKPEPGEDLPAIAASILKIYPGYDELYIDNFGGAYTANTSAAIRGNAVHYINPFKK